MDDQAAPFAPSLPMELRSRIQVRQPRARKLDGNPADDSVPARRHSLIAVLNCEVLLVPTPPEGKRETRNGPFSGVIDGREE